MGLWSCPQMIHQSPRVCPWGPRFILKSLQTLLKMKSAEWEVALLKQRVNKQRENELEKEKNGYMVLQRVECERPTLVPNVSFKKRHGSENQLQMESYKPKY